MAPSRALLRIPTYLSPHLHCIRMTSSIRRPTYSQPLLTVPTTHIRIPQQQGRRQLSTEASAGSGPAPPDYLSEAELKIFNKLKDTLSPENLVVQDISGGCGSMYALDIASPKFKGLTMIKQHRLVNEILGEEIKQWHGVQLRTRAP
ncbi:bola-like protein [Eremomyces bilateralis CBS 781.70]|uniref:Bola-like protein n=1 Tax=Eremomyces bilateralis CBS 781.70 TaxID=1392243 RepID=A0A6G1FR17_9PEZI|nr:bola-like protein [Eremomyces bilateralis CBS 781.70]KAF1808234.1 bola-like protein [Eremomyces bilateralis CBS 781.70]